LQYYLSVKFDVCDLKKNIKYYTSFLLLFFLAVKCNDGNDEKKKTNEQTARTYCGSCHLFPEPNLLDKNTWKQHVLPSMAAMLGIDAVYQIPLYKPANKNPISVEDWNKILSYYLTQAPDTMPTQGRLPVKEYTDLFSAKKILSPDNSFPSTSYVKIDEGNHWIYAASSFDSTLNIYDEHLKPVAKFNVHGVIVDMYFKDSLLKPGERNGLITNIGIMNPNDRKAGTVDTFSITAKGSLTYRATLFDSMPRPVYTTMINANNGKQDYLICGFGNKTQGALMLINKTGKQKILRALPGAITAYVDDYNHDGLPDILVLMAQAQEGIYLLINKGNDEFETKEILRFPPIYGSSYFELDDFNNDGFKDILYTCGDNADYSGGVLKNYHGVYIFLNDGRNHFSQKYFFPIHGCYKAIARDFDKDGDLDIAAISYFPDMQNQPQESFVYLEQKKYIQFEARAIKEFNEGRWLTIDAGDIDGDGDEDIILGSLIPPLPNVQERWKKSGIQKTGLMLLENKKVTR